MLLSLITVFVGVFDTSWYQKFAEERKRRIIWSIRSLIFNLI
jgi:hypothetical protein